LLWAAVAAVDEPGGQDVGVPGMEGRMARLGRLGRLVDDEVAADGAAEGVRGRLQRLCTVLTGVLPASGAGVSC